MFSTMTVVLVSSSGDPSGDPIVGVALASIVAVLVAVGVWVAAVAAVALDDGVADAVTPTVVVDVAVVIGVDELLTVGVAVACGVSLGMVVGVWEGDSVLVREGEVVNVGATTGVPLGVEVRTAVAVAV